MPANIIIGAQWGDEGKGRIADWLAADSDMVARYAGGDNAGHTVNVGGDTFKLHLVPSGILHEDVICLLGGGMVINPAKLVEELDGLAAREVDISPQRLLIADSAHIITPAHLALDGASEAHRADKALGTTKRGIGPAYTDKAARIGLRAGLMRSPDAFGEAVSESIKRGNRELETHYGQPTLDASEIVEAYQGYARRLAPHLVDGPQNVHRVLENSGALLCEGAQGTLLDIDHGNYPYVTSSSTVTGGALIGLGFGPNYVDRVVGVAKAYSTRVGAGPFPTELHSELGDQMRGTGQNPWDEYGTTTGRPRRCGWLDAVALQHAARINGLSELALTKLDILSGFDELKIAIAYDLRGEQIEHLPLDQNELRQCEPVYETVPGWSDDITGVRRYLDLPKQALDYVERIEYLLDLTVSIISVGPERSQTIIR
jgi:adenylosuccinate synthase